MFKRVQAGPGATATLSNGEGVAGSEGTCGCLGGCGEEGGALGVRCRCIGGLRWVYKCTGGYRWVYRCRGDLSVS